LRYHDDETRARFDAYRQPLHAGEISLADICARERLRLAVDRVHYFNRFVTPAGRPRRFDTRFFLADAPPAQAGRHDTRETVDSIWISPREALTRHADRAFDLMAVTRVQLGELAAYPSKATLLEAASTRRTFAVFRPQAPAVS
jgi:hypothetical protein